MEVSSKKIAAFVKSLIRGEQYSDTPHLPKLLCRVLRLRPEALEEMPPRLEIWMLNRSVWGEAIMECDELRARYGVEYVLFNSGCSKLVAASLEHEDLSAVLPLPPPPLREGFNLLRPSAHRLVGEQQVLRRGNDEPTRRLLKYTYVSIHIHIHIIASPPPIVAVEFE